MVSTKKRGRPFAFPEDVRRDLARLFYDDGLTPEEIRRYHFPRLNCRQIENHARAQRKRDLAEVRSFNQAEPTGSPAAPGPSAASD